jgi:hypothetical protein
VFCLIAVVCVVCVAGFAAGCGEASGGVESTNEGSIEMPDVAGGDDADAGLAVESEGLTATLADADDDPGFDSSRDATGCEVEDQEPPAGEMLEEGTEATITVSCAQIDWENQEGPAWERFNAVRAGVHASRPVPGGGRGLTRGCDRDDDYHVDLRLHLDTFKAAKDRPLLPAYPAWSAIGVAELITEGALVEIRVVAVDPRTRR